MQKNNKNKWQASERNDADSDGSSIQEHADNKINNNNTNDNYCTGGGGFGGNPAQLPHCAPTYAAILALILLSWARGGTVVVNTSGEGKGDGEEGCNNNNNTNDNNYMPYNRRGTHVDDDDESVHEKKLVNWSYYVTTTNHHKGLHQSLLNL